MIFRLAEGYDFKDTDKPDLKDNIKEKIEDIIITIDSIKELDEKEEILLDLIDNLTSTFNHENRGFSSGEILYVDDNVYKAIKYIVNYNSIVISLNLTYFGNLEILIKDDNSQCCISFFCEDSERVAAIKNGSDLLFSVLKDVLHKNVNIFFYNRKVAAEKIIEIYSMLRLSRGIDVRV